MGWAIGHALLKCKVANGAAGLAWLVVACGIVKGQIDLLPIVMGQMRQQRKAIEEGKASIQDQGTGSRVGLGDAISAVFQGLPQLWRGIVAIAEAIEPGLHLQGGCGLTGQRGAAQKRRGPDRQQCQRAVDPDKS